MQERYIIMFDFYKNHSTDNVDDELRGVVD